MQTNTFDKLSTSAVPVFNAIQDDTIINIHKFLASVGLDDVDYMTEAEANIYVSAAAQPVPYIDYKSDDDSEPQSSTIAYNSTGHVCNWVEESATWDVTPTAVILTIGKGTRVKYIVWTKETSILARARITADKQIIHTINAILAATGTYGYSVQYDILCNIYGGCWDRHNVAPNGKSDNAMEYCVKVNSEYAVLYTTALPIRRMQETITIDARVIFA